MSASEPMLIEPKFDVIEPESSAPTDVRTEARTVGPRVVELMTKPLLTRKLPPVGTLTLPVVREIPPENVEVPASPTMVVVEVLPTYTPFSDEKEVEEAELNVWRPVQMFALVRSSATVPEVVIVPPVSPAPAVMDVTVPLFEVKHRPPTATQPP